MFDDSEAKSDDSETTSDESEPTLMIPKQKWSEATRGVLYDVMMTSL